MAFVEISNIKLKIAGDGDFMKERKQTEIRVVILADVPVWVIPGLEHLHRSGVYATWLEALIPEFESIGEVGLHWICMSKQTEQDIEHHALGQTFHVLRRGKKSISILTGYWVERRRILRLIDKIQPDLVHAWGVEDVFGLAGARVESIPKLFSLQGCLSACLQTMPKSSFWMKIQASYESRTVAAYSIATGESPIAIKHLKRINPDIKTHLIDYGVPNEFYAAKWDPAENPEIIFVGSVTEAKGIRDLCDVMKSDKLKGIKLKVAGDGDLLAELKEKSDDNIEWLGRLNRSELIKHIENSWALVMPTYADTGPSVVKEARVVGLPVITTSAAGASVYITDHKSGFLITPGDRAALSQAVSDVCVTQENCLMLGGHGWDEIRESLHPGTSVRKFVELYRELC